MKVFYDVRGNYGVSVAVRVLRSGVPESAYRASAKSPVGHEASLIWGRWKNDSGYATAQENEDQNAGRFKVETRMAARFETPRFYVGIPGKVRAGERFAEEHENCVSGARPREC